MASQWAAKFPIVTVPNGLTPKRVTFVYPYYENFEFLVEQMSRWARYPPDLKPWCSVVVIDDGSPVPVSIASQSAIDLRLFRIDVDVPWNWLAARNIGAHYARDGWLLLTDMDHVVPDATLRALVYGQHDPRVVYAFSRREHTGETVTPHSASFFMTKAMFWTIGGYDEALSGHYGTDGEYRRRAMQYAAFKVLTDELIRYEFVADSCTSRYARKLPADSASVARLVSSRGKGWKPTVLSFPHREVTVTVPKAVPA